MRHFSWSSEKNAKLIEDRGISFERIVIMLNRQDFLDIIEHPNQNKYPGQSMFIIEMDGYCYLVPFVENENEVFLKTIILSRKATKKYLEK